MNHPRHEILQDYFENQLKLTDEQKVQIHLLNCDQCTKTLADFAVIETRLQRQTELSVSARTKEKIFLSAALLLKEKRERQVQKEWLSTYLEEWKNITFPELKIPALQLASLTLVLTVVISVERNQGSFEDIHEPISSDVSVYTGEE